MLSTAAEADGGDNVVKEPEIHTPSNPPRSALQSPKGASLLNNSMKQLGVTRPGGGSTTFSPPVPKKSNISMVPARKKRKSLYRYACLIFKSLSSAVAVIMSVFVQVKLQ